MPMDELHLFPYLQTAPPALIGIALAIGGNLIISFALTLTKYAHNLNQMRAEPLHYTQLPLWWSGLVATVIGECGNFAAYGFAGASLIAPLGAVSVLANAFIAALVLGEGFRLRDLTGCGLCIAGGSVVVGATPQNGRELDTRGFLHAVSATPFVVYIIMLTAVVAVMLGLQDTYGHRHVAYYVLLCSLLGSVTVLSCKGVATFLNLWLCCGAPSPLDDPVLYMLLLVLGSTCVLQIRYLNEAMERFGNTETVPVYYVLFTLSTIMGSNILYGDFANEDRGTVLLFASGCGLTFGGVWLLTSKRTSSRSSGISTSDERRTPMLAGYVKDPSPGTSRRLSGDGLQYPDEPPLDRLFMPPAPAGGRHASASVGSAPLALQIPAEDDYLDAGVPLGLLNSPLALSGDVLRRTFSTRLSSFNERAAQGASSTGRAGHRRTTSV